MKILNFGSCNIDFVYSLDHIVRVGESETTHKMETFPGGKGLNQSIAVSHAGAKVYHAGCLGHDGGILRDILYDSGVDVSFLKTVEEKNGHAIIQVSATGENSIFLYPGSNKTVTEVYIDEILVHFGAGDILLLQNEISNVGYLVERAYQKKMCIVLNPSPFNDTIRGLDLRKISYLVLNEVEAREITGRETPEEAIAFLKSRYPNLCIMLTLGEKGCIYTDATCELYQPAFSVTAVDTTAAGDTFTGYFVAGLASGEAMKDVLCIASVASAISVTRSGAAPSIPVRSEVMERLGEFKPNKKNDKTERTREIIDTYIEGNIKTASLGELSRKLGYSTVYTGVLVKKLTGRSFSKLLQDKRCAMAAELLLSTDRSINEIIGDVGYENESFFRRIFEEKYGKKPLTFRKREVK